MTRPTLLLAGLLLSSAAAAAPWTFSAPVPITGSAQPGVFHHLDSAGKRNIAVAGDVVAVTWADNHSGRSEVYAAFKGPNQPGPQGTERISGKGPAYAPAIIPDGDGGFLVAWEGRGGIRLRRIAPSSRPNGEGVRVADGGRQVTLVEGPQGVFAAWAARGQGRYRHIRVAPVKPAGPDGPEVGEAVSVEEKPPGANQLYPAMAETGEGLEVAWEDRREGHSRIYRAFAPQGRDFGEPVAINEQLPARSAKYGRGTGVTRVVLTATGGGNVAAAWMDKRYFKSGYDIYAAFSDDGGRTYGPNQPVFDMFGQDQAQWHPAIAGGGAAPVAIAWDDARDGNDDVWLTWRTGTRSWSADLALPGAGGPGYQNHPALAIGPDGDLFAAYTAEDEENGPTRLYFVHGTRR
ncbi:MAG TPA: hypothetical protein VKA64_10585 [Gammaproteobacteria bacterium]|nr:hypothetical protein [Gammaproteobacteria bacterium]